MRDPRGGPCHHDHRHKMKEVAVEFELDGKTCRLGAIARAAA